MRDDPCIRLVVFDWAGTTVDHGCFAPVAPFVDAFAAHGVSIAPAEARGPMGLEKRDHIRSLLQDEAIGARWRQAHGAPPSEDAVSRIFETFVPMQLESVDRNSRLIDGLLDVVAELRARGIAIATTTGYFAEAAERCYAAADAQGYAPDLNVNPSHVREGRPAPWMMFQAMERLDIYPPAFALKVGDTQFDIEEGLNAGAWSAGVSATGSEIARTAEELDALPADERAALIDMAAAKLRAAGAHDVIESVRDVPALIDRIDARLRDGESPARSRASLRA